MSESVGGINPFQAAMLYFELEALEVKLNDGRVMHTEKGMLQTLLRAETELPAFSAVSEQTRFFAADAVACAHFHLLDPGLAVEFIRHNQPDTTVDLIGALVEGSEVIEDLRLQDGGVRAAEDGFDGENIIYREIQ